jgi:hypothetical protein
MSNATGAQAQRGNLPALVTEEQARTLKICPFSMSQNEPKHCLASSCMLWQWQLWPKYYGVPPDDQVGRCGLVSQVELPIPVNTKDIRSEPKDFDFTTGQFRPRSEPDAGTDPQQPGSDSDWFLAKWLQSLK